MQTAQPKLNLWKDVIRVGRYRHPTRRFTINVNRRRLDHWARTFARMSANGVRVHIPANHSDAAEDNRGYVLQLCRVGDRLMALCQFIGADAIRDVARNQVSIGVAPVFVDGTGTIYRDAIVHVALTPVPVVPGQGSFIAQNQFIAAGTVPAAEGRRSASPSTLSSAAPAGVFNLSEGRPLRAAANIRGGVAFAQRRADMAQTLLPCSEETLSSLHDLVPGLADIPGEQKLEQILQFIQGLIAQAQTPPAGQDLSLADNPVLNQALKEAVKAKRDLCVSRGALTPAVADALLAQLLPDNAANSIITLSRHDSPATLTLSIFSALADNQPPPLGQRTGSQGGGLIPLSRATPGETAPQGPPLYEKMAALADGRSVQL